ncbi:MAG: hypothetical protein JSW62_01085 [Thermoplasmatales archaeon]|nr:MAG: hypothetical protein JSW62_01085 [Thermoplasmatales archaeon]
MSAKIKIDRNTKIVISVLVIVCLILSGLYTYFEFFYKEEIVEETNDKEIDDRISPLTNQAVFMTIHRIRKKGIIDVMINSGSDILNKIPIKNSAIAAILDGLRPGIGWNEKTSYYYIAVLDDYEYRGRDIYDKWDTSYMNQAVFREVEDEKPLAEIEFKIIENIEEKKLFRSEVKQKERECFKVIYDFRTGFWNGDDYFNDSDGYGHFDGKNYEIWFNIYQTSFDEDNIPWWIEVNVLGTDPKTDDSKLDPDGDGIPTEWEWRWGYDPFKWDNHTTLDPDLDGLQNTEEYIMSKWLANPFYPEIYIETDYMEKTPGGKFKFEIVKEQSKLLPRIKKSPLDGWEHVFYEESQQMLIELFNEHGISVHIDDGVMGGGGDLLPFGRGNQAYEQEAGVVAGFYNNNFADERKGIFRYLVVAYGGGWCHPQDSNHYYDCICIPHNYNFFKNQLSYALTERTKRIGQAVQVLHELGHSLAIYWDGVDNSTGKAGNPPDYPWLDYVSCMNYDYFADRVYDYSDGSNGEYDHDDWGSLDLTFFQKPSLRMEGLGWEYK